MINLNTALRDAFEAWAKTIGYPEVFHLDGTPKSEFAAGLWAGWKSRETQPIDMLLYCPACGEQHIDAPELNSDWCDGCTPENCPGGCGRSGQWDNPPHKSHLCSACNHIWRPADVPTNGVAAIKTKGENDSPVTEPRYTPPARSAWDRRHEP